jgi:hypothetical protein
LTAGVRGGERRTWTQLVELGRKEREREREREKGRNK